MMAKRSMSQGGVAYMPPTEPEARRRTRDVGEALSQSRSLGDSTNRDFEDIAAQRDFPLPLLKIPGEEDRPLTPELARILLRVAELLSGGKAVYMVEYDTQLTTQEAADLLGVSRPTLVKLLEDGHIPFTKVGRHRRVMLDDLQKYAAQRHQEHIAMFDELAADEDPSLTLDNPLIRH
ncbi:helix-turn-helix domain-containing protein [Bifidobacterium choerinum]|uniref:helix-turn-helix domain-containing protein n=2 Tax=Bifidobacterium choerinum TaxID=35760 RepID=UPI001F4D1050|nr:helix-turn-helix domain-containing protein [Bifidobacterium choerinum]